MQNLHVNVALFYKNTMVESIILSKIVRLNICKYPHIQGVFLFIGP